MFLNHPVETGGYCRATSTKFENEGYCRATPTELGYWGIESENKILIDVKD